MTGIEFWLSPAAIVEIAVFAFLGGGFAYWVIKRKNQNKLKEKEI